MTWARALCSLVIALLANSVAAQSPSVRIEPRMGMAERRSNASMRVDSDLVLVPVVVTDRAGHLVLGLEKEDFRIFDDNVEQQIRHFALDDAPVSIVLLFDTSGSMAQKMQTSRFAVSEFLNVANPEDEFALIEFADRPRLAAKFTEDANEIQTRLSFLQAHGRTALIDAVFLALDQLKHARHARKAIVIISDGGDNSSRFSSKELKRRVQEADAQIYSIGVVDYGPLHGVGIEDLDGPALLSEIAAESGGRFFEADTADSLTETAKRIGTALRNQYVLGYSPSASRRDGRFHRILVKVPQPKGRTKVKTSFRSSYLAPAE